MDRPRDGAAALDDWHLTKLVEQEERELENPSCGPQCASSVLATRYAKILRQEQLLKTAARTLERLEGWSSRAISTPPVSAVRNMDVDQSRALRREITTEERNPA